MKIFIGIILIVVLVLILRVGELYTQLARYQKYWDRVNQSPINEGDIVYVAFGDSAAQGIGASRPDKGYVGLVANQVSANTGRPVHVINLSKSGATISDVLDTQLPKYKALQISDAQVITVDIGANDVVRTDLGNFKKDMDRLMSELPEGAVIADIPSFSGSRYARLDYKVDKANEIMDELAKKHGIELAGVHDNTKKNHSLRTFGGDFFHPSNFGYKNNWEPAFMAHITAGVNGL